MIRVFVKGDKHRAALAASARRIPFAFETEVRSAGVVITVGKVNEQHRHTVVDWYLETNQDQGAAPGDCLNWMEVT